MEKNYKKRNLLEDLRMPLFNVNFVMIYKIQKMLVLLKNHLNYLKDSIFECFFKKYNRLLLFKKKMILFMMENPRPEEENIIKNTRNLFRLEEQLNYTVITDIRNLF